MLEMIKSDSPFITGSIEGALMTYCYQVKCGSKPIALTQIKDKYVDIVCEYISKTYKLKTYIQDVVGYPEWKTIFIYKHEYLIDIIKRLPEHPQTAYEHWVIGKACGYSDESIGEYIKSKL